MLSESYSITKSMFVTDSARKTADILSELEAVDAGLTFKDLGVISTDKPSLRPRTTRLFNLVKNILPKRQDSTINLSLNPGIVPTSSFGLGIAIENYVALPSSTKKFLNLNDKLTLDEEI